MSPLAQINNHWGGLESIQNIKTLDDNIAEDKALQQLADELRAIHAAMLAMPIQILSVAEKDQFNAINETLKTLWSKYCKQL